MHQHTDRILTQMPLVTILDVEQMQPCKPSFPLCFETHPDGMYSSQEISNFQVVGLSYSCRWGVEWMAIDAGNPIILNQFITLISKMELLYSEEDFLVFKIRAIAALFSYPLLFRKASETELVTKDSSPAKRKFVLITSDGGVISTLDSVLAHLTSQYPTSQEQNHLLEDIRQSFEIPLLALISVTSETSIDLNPSEKLKVDQQSRLDISKSLRKYEGILDSRTFLVGEGITIVDATLFSVLTDVLKFDLLSKRSYPSLFRWLETVGSTLKLKGVEDIDSILNVAAFDSDGVGSGTSTSTKWSRGRSRIKELLVEGSAAVGKEVVVKGWVRTARSAEKGQILFVELNDGSTSKSIQLVLTAEKTIGIEAVASSGGVHACISCRGLVVASPAQGQAFEIAVTTAQVLGPVYGGDNGEIGGKNYPMAKKKHSLEFLREKVRIINYLFSFIMGE